MPRNRTAVALALLGLSLGALFWTVDSVIDAVFFRQGTIAGQIFSPAGTEIWTRTVVALLLASFGAVSGLIVGRQVRTAAALRQSESRHRALLRVIPDMMFRLSAGGVYLDFVPAPGIAPLVPPEQFLGRRMADVLPRQVSDLAMHHVEQAMATGQTQVFQYELSIGGQRRHYEAALIASGDDEVMSIIRDITQRTRDEDRLRQSEERHRELAVRLQSLLRELDHRVKNNLASLYALVAMYENSATSIQDFAESLRGKLLAMKAVHEIIAAAGWQTVDLQTLLKKLAEQFQHDTAHHRWPQLDGPPLRVAPRQAGPLAMVLQELFTNCAKHGAYAVDAGAVRLSWQVLQHNGHRQGVRLIWQETGGPTPRAPQEFGRGLKLIEGFAQFELGGRSEFHFDPGGFRCVLDCDLVAAAEQ